MGDLTNWMLSQLRRHHGDARARRVDCCDAHRWAVYAGVDTVGIGPTLEAAVRMAYAGVRHG